MTSINNNPGVSSPQSVLMTGTERAGRAGVPSKLQPQFDAAQSAFKDRMGDLNTQLKNESDPQRKLQLQNEIANLQSSYDALVEKLAAVTVGGAVQSVGGGERNIQMDFATEIQGLRTSLIESYDRIPAALVNIQNPGVGTENNPDVGAPPSSGSSAADGGEDVHHFIGMTPEELVNQMDKDPKAFYSELRNMGGQDRADVMQQVQTHLQQMNQLFSMMSQMSQAMHDTTKAVISNLRV
jgi:hypothetical protein